MDPNIRRRFELIRPQLSNPQPGMAQAARDRWDAMVEKYGDPDAKPDRGAFDPYFLGRPYTGRSAETIIVDFAYQPPSDFATIFNDLFSHATRSAAERVRAQRDSVATQLELGRECGRAVTYILDTLGLEVEGIAGGPWTIYDHTDESHGPFGMRAVIDFARERGFR